MEQIKSRWYADIYDQQETETEDVDLLLSVIGNHPLHVLEVCCGSGRILVPLAKAGHHAAGFDMDEYMLAKIPAKAVGLANLSYYKADAVSADWGKDYDLVVLAGNILINIQSTLPYQDAQKLFIQKAASCLKPTGHLYLDFNLSTHPERVFANSSERIIFDGTDFSGVYGKYIILNGTYDPVTQITAGDNCTELRLPDGQELIFHGHYQKHVPTLSDVRGWLKQAGFIVEQEYGDYLRNPIGEATHRAIIYARQEA